MEHLIKLIEALAWPVAVLILAFGFRNELRKMFNRISKLKYKELEATFDKELSQVENRTKLYVQPEERLIFSNAIRAGILGLTKTLSNELAEDDILINAVCPGWTLTQRVEELAQSVADNRGLSSRSVVDEWAKQIPMKRLAQPEEIANLVVFLASKQASYITGTVIQVDGGYIKSVI